MTNKIKYKQFAKRENLPIFMQPFWFDSICNKNEYWDVILFEKGGEIWGSFVYVFKNKYGLKLITMPKITSVLGPYIKYPRNQKYYKKLSWEKEIINYFIENLPKFDYFNINCNYTISNWLPFYWKGFDQITRYTYRIEQTINMEELSVNFETDIRRRRRKAKKLGIKILESDDINTFYKLNKMTFDRQGLTIPYSFDYINRLYSGLKMNDACKMFFAEYENKIIAVNFLVYDENTVYYLMGGIDPEKKDLGAMDVVLFESIKFALETNRDFDFEGSMIENIEKYFRSFGAIQKPYFQIIKINSKILKLRNCLKYLLR